MDDYVLKSPIPYDPAFEKFEDDENETIEELIQTLDSISKTTSNDNHHAVRSVHAKCHGLLRGKLKVKPDLPAYLAQGLFAKDGEYPVALRLSTSPGDILDDNVSTPRGMAIKVFNVQGKRLYGDASNNTQDFLLVDGPAFLKADAKSFVSSLKLLAKTTDKAEGFKKAFSSLLQSTEKVIESMGGKSPAVISMGGHPETNILGETFYSQVPILYGPYMVKVSVAPASANLKALTKAPVDLKDAPNGLRETVATFFKDNAAEWEVRVQFCNNLDSMPIEDASVIWPEDESPYITVATIVVEPQTSWDEKISPMVEDKLAFGPWNGIAAHRPLGSVMRARKATYDSSTNYRKQFNGCPLGEVRSLDKLN